MFKIWLYYLFLAHSDVQKQSGSTVVPDRTGINNGDDILLGMNKNFDVYHIYSGLSFVEIQSTMSFLNFLSA